MILDGSQSLRGVSFLEDGRRGNLTFTPTVIASERSERGNLTLRNKYNKLLNKLR